MTEIIFLLVIVTLKSNTLALTDSDVGGWVLQTQSLYVAPEIEFSFF